MSNGTNHTIASTKPLARIQCLIKMAAALVVMLQKYAPRNGMKEAQALHCLSESIIRSTQQIE